MATITGTGNPELLQGTINPDLISGLGGDDQLYGYDANDTLNGGLGDDFLYGGSGNDILIGGAGEDFFYGQSGIDTASYSSASSGVTLNLENALLSAGDAAGDIFFSIERFVLSGFDDTFISRSENAARNVDGGLGNDSIVGSALAEILSGGDGNDTLDAFAGEDTLNGNGGNDTLLARSDAERLNGGAGFDIASYALARAVFIDLSDPTNTVGDAGGDIYISIEQFNLSQSHDIFTASNAVARVFGLDGQDSIVGGSANDILDGGEDSDTLNGGGGNDSLFGQSSEDILRGGLGSDTLDGGSGPVDFIDTAYYGGASVTVNLGNMALSTGEAKDDLLVNIDRINLAATSNLYIGGAVNIEAFSSNILTARPGSGAERLNAGAGGTLDYSGTGSAVGITVVDQGPGFGGAIAGTGAAAGDLLVGFDNVILTGSGDEADLLGLSAVTVGGGGGNDTISIGESFFASAGTASVNGGNGDDSISADAVGNITANGGANNDIIQIGTDGFANAIGSSGNDTIEASGSLGADASGGIGADDLTAISGGGLARAFGDDGNDTIFAMAAMLEVHGGTGSDTMTVIADIGSSGTAFGDGGNDTIAAGSAAAYTINGGIGNDRLIADSGADTFEFNTNWGADRVVDFTDLSDGLHFAGIAGLDDFGDLTVTNASGSTRVTFGGNTILIVGLAVGDFSAADCTFA